MSNIIKRGKNLELSDDKLFSKEAIVVGSRLIWEQTDFLGKF
jgi:hypothetical protein